MSVTKPGANVVQRRDGGVYAVEFALVVLTFFWFVIGVIEVARAMYLVNTLQEVTRRAATAASLANPKDNAERQRIRERAVFLDGPGGLPVGKPVTDKHVQIEYYALIADSTGKTSMQLIPAESLSCPVKNRQICMSNPNDPLCVRFVRARICQPSDGGNCDTQKVQYTSLTSLVLLSFGLPHASTIVPAGALGYKPGMSPCPET